MVRLKKQLIIEIPRSLSAEKMWTQKMNQVSKMDLNRTWMEINKLATKIVMVNDLKQTLQAQLLSV